MKGACAGALLALLGGAVPAPAQFFAGQPGHFTTAGGFSFHLHSGSPFFGPAFSARFGTAYRFRYASVWPDWWGWPGLYGYGAPFYAPLVIQQPIIVVQPQPLVLAAPDDDVPAQLNPNDFIVIRPHPAPAPQQLPPPAVQNPPKPREVPAPRVPQRRPVELGVKPRELPGEPAPEANAKAESARQVRLGKEAFEAMQYGRATERFERAAAVAPDEALPYFMLAQARFAAGKYREAVAAIADGMKRQPNWPASRFQPRDLYGNNIGLFDNHLQALRQALEAFPDDAGLLFLLGYELWFDGKKDEARRMFDKAARRATDPTLIEAFLAEGEKVVRR